MTETQLTAIKGVGEITAARLREAGLTTVAAVASAEADRLASATRFPAGRAAAIRDAAAALAPSLPAEVPKGKRKAKKKKDEKKAKKGKGKKGKTAKAGKSAKKRPAGKDKKGKSKGKKKGKK